jgi:hypothetical protein
MPSLRNVLGSMFNEIYRADGNYPKFYRNFVGSSDNGRSSLRITNTFSLEIVRCRFAGRVLVKS